MMPDSAGNSRQQASEMEPNVTDYPLRKLEWYRARLHELAPELAARLEEEWAEQEHPEWPRRRTYPPAAEAAPGLFGGDQ